MSSEGIEPRPSPIAGPTRPRLAATYQITLQGHLNQNWQAWFAAATVELIDDGSTVLTCTVVDQAALYGLLAKARDLGLPLISVLRV